MKYCCEKFKTEVGYTIVYSCYWQIRYEEHHCIGGYEYRELFEIKHCPFCGKKLEEPDE